MLQLTNLSKRYASKVLFADLNWRLGAGERVGLVGRNGCGKTTLLTILAGREVADGGSLQLTPGERLSYLPQEAPRQHTGSVRQRVEGGAEALVAQKAELARLTAALAAAPAAEAAALSHAYDEAEQAFRLAGGYQLTARAEAVLQGLGFVGGAPSAGGPPAIDGPLSALSGGWWMRAELARLLVAQPDFLLMDEPTNHLDAQSLLWLENFLQNYPGTWVVVSHDRAFLNRCVKTVAELAHGTLTCTPGNYDAFLAARTLAASQRAAEAEGLARKRAHLEGFVTRFGAKASKAKQAQSRQKALDKMAPVAAPERQERAMSMRLPEAPRSGRVVLRCTGIHFGYGTRPLFADAHLTLERGNKVAILGPNGAGKTTLLKLAAAALRPSAGEIALGHNVLPYYFAQHQLDMLQADNTVLQEMARAMPQGSRSALRGLLGAFLFDDEGVGRQVGALSGGEKARLALAKMLATPANLLLLDEPTNHLDLESREVLQRALVAFDGTVLFISHDRYFVQALASHTVQLVGNGAVDLRPVGAPAPQAAPDAEAAAPAPAGGPKGGTGKAQYLAQKAARNAQVRRKKVLDETYARIGAQEQRLAAIDTALADAAIFADAKQARALLEERAQISEDSLPELYAVWERLYADTDS